MIDSDNTPLAGTVTNTDDLAIGRYSGSIDTEQAIGKIDEVRISATVRTGEWIKTCYNNQNEPSTFYTVGLQEGEPVPPVPELPTILLFSSGLLVLAGYVWMKKRMIYI